MVNIYIKGQADASILFPYQNHYDYHLMHEFNICLSMISTNLLYICHTFIQAKIYVNHAHLDGFMYQK